MKLLLGSPFDLKVLFFKYNPKQVLINLIKSALPLKTMGVMAGT
jgi:hypothetical protein